MRQELLLPQDLLLRLPVRVLGLARDLSCAFVCAVFVLIFSSSARAFSFFSARSSGSRRTTSVSGISRLEGVFVLAIFTATLP